MNYSNFCEIHKQKVALFSCAKCSRNVCSTCAISGSNFCPKCSGVNIFKVEKKHSQKEIRNILLSGFVICSAFILINTLPLNLETIPSKDLLLPSTLFFAFGISIASAVYFVKKTSVFEEIQEIPFIGHKVMKYIVIGTSLIGLPILYFFYLLFNYFKPIQHPKKSKPTIVRKSSSYTHRESNR